MNKPGIAKSNKIFVTLISSALLALYIFSISKYFTSAPSELMSRAVRVGDTELESSGKDGTHLLTMLSPVSDSIILAAVDGKETRLIDINYRGEVQREININLDLSEMSQISGYVGENEKIYLFAHQHSLERIIIDFNEKAWRREVLIEDAESFRSNGSYLIIEKPDALVGYDSVKNLLTEPLVSENVKYYDFDIAGDNFTLVSVADKASGNYDVLMTIGKIGFKEANTVSILNDSSDPIYRKLHDIRTDGNKVSLLFVMRDNKYGLNYINIMELARDTGKLTDSFQVRVPIQNSRYSLLESPAESASFLLQRKTSYGYNLAVCRISGNGEVTFSDITKTRPYSLESLVFKVGDWNSLVFSDFEEENRTVYYASQHPEMKRSTTRMRAEDIGRIAGAVATNTILTLFFGTIYLLIISTIPLGIVMVLTARTRSRRVRSLIICGIGAAVYTALKLTVVFYTINKTDNYTFTAPLIGGEPALYAILIIMSVISYTLISRQIKPDLAPGKSVSGLFFQFLAIDSIQFTLVFLIYGTTTLMMGKF